MKVSIHQIFQCKSLCPVFRVPADDFPDCSHLIDEHTTLTTGNGFVYFTLYGLKEKELLRLLGKMGIAELRLAHVAAQPLLGESLQRLEIYDVGFKELTGLPASLKSLTINCSAIASIAYFPRQLEELELRYLPTPFQLPSPPLSLRRLRIDGRNLGKENDFSNYLKDIFRLEQLEELRLSVCLKKLPRLPVSLRLLEVSSSNLEDISAVSALQQLEELYCCSTSLDRSSLRSITFSKKLRVADFSDSNEVPSLEQLQHVTLLKISREFIEEIVKKFMPGKEIHW